jgi:hypothetical protein
MNKSNSRQWVRIFGITTILILIFSLIVSLKIPSTFSGFFTKYSLPLFLITWVLFSLSFRIQGWKGWFIGLGITLIFVALPLSFKWTSGFSDNRVIAGLIPYKDQYYFYHGAHEILFGNLISANYLNASWRPLFPAIISNILFITGQNLKWTLAILTFLCGIAFYLSGREMKNVSGNWAAGLFMVLLLLYSNYFIGLFATELVGIAVACLAFTLLLSAAQKREKWSLFFGIVILMLAICIRAGAFLIFPMIAIWSGWVFKNDKKYSWKFMGTSLLVVVISFFVFTTLSQKLLVEPGNPSFGNFAFTIYGQAMGGTGFTRAIQDVGVDTSLVYSKTLEVIQNHPVSLLIGILKSYRDVLLPKNLILVPFNPLVKPVWMNYALWFIMILLIIWASIKLIKQWRLPVSSLLIATTLGILFSVPFLPPIDGGNRAYTSVAPFIIALPVFGLGEILSRWKKNQPENNPAVIFAIKSAGVLLAVLILFTPILFNIFKFQPVLITPTCLKNQTPFEIQLDPDSYVDIIPTDKTGFGIVPEISLGDFKANGAEPWDDFYQFLVSEVSASSDPTRIMVAKDLIGENKHFFVGDTHLFRNASPGQIISGCAEAMHTQFQSVFIIRSIVPTTN